MWAPLQPCSLLLLLLLLLLVESASAQMTAEVMVAVSPDWSSWRVLLMLCLSVPMVVAHLAVLALLFRRRRLYPIANRGSVVILICGTNTLLGIMANAAMHIAYPMGMPCGMHALNMWLFMPLALALLARGWTLIFRLEIANYLTELAWRQSKIAQLRDSGLFKLDNDSNCNNNNGCGMGNAPMGATPTLAPQSIVRVESDGHTRGWALPPNAAPRIASASATHLRVEPAGNATSATGATAAAAAAATEGPLAMPTLEPTTIPGHAFITRRWLTEPRWVLVGAGAACSGVALLIALVSVFDADQSFADEWRRSRGLPDDGIDSHYADGVFFAGPRCFAYSIKVRNNRGQKKRGGGVGVGVGVGGRKKGWGCRTRSDCDCWFVARILTHVARPPAWPWYRCGAARCPDVLLPLDDALRDPDGGVEQLARRAQRQAHEDARRRTGRICARPARGALHRRPAGCRRDRRPS